MNITLYWSLMPWIGVTVDGRQSGPSASIKLPARITAS
jgi:hypothetical protein